MASRRNDCIHRGIVRDATGFRLFSNEWFDTADVSTSNSVAIGHIPCLDLDLVEVWTNATDGFLEVFPNAEAGGYTLSGSRDMENRYLTFGGDWAFPSGDTDVIHISYGIKSLTVNTEISLTTGDIAFNIESAYSDTGNVTKKGLVDSGRYVLTSISKVSGEVLTPDNWTNDFRAMTITLGTIDTKLQNISGSVGGISLSLGSIDADLDTINARLLNISGSVGGISLSLGSIDTDLDTTNARLLNISGSVGGISITLGTIETDLITTNAKLENISGSVGGISLSLGSIDTDLDTTNATLLNISGSVGGISLSLGNIDIDLDTTNAKLIDISGSVGGISLNLGSIDSKLVDTNIIGQVKISDGITIASIDVGTNAILVKEVTGAGEIANVNLTSITGTAQTGGDWTANFDAIETNTDRIIIANTTKIAGEVSINNTILTLGLGTANIGTVNGSEVSIKNSGITLATGNLHIGEVSINNTGLTLTTGTANIGTVNGSEVSINNSGITLATGNLHIGEVSINNTGLTLTTGMANIGTVHDSEVYVKNTILTISTGTNATSWNTGQLNILWSNTHPAQMADMTIKGGFRGVIKAKYGNIGTICVGDTSAKALSTNTGFFSLRGNEAMDIGVNNFNLVWLDSTVNGEGIEYYSEWV